MVFNFDVRAIWPERHQIALTLKLKTTG